VTRSVQVICAEGGVHGEPAMCCLRSGIPAAVASSTTTLLHCGGLPTRAPATVATSQAHERRRLSREPGMGPACLGAAAWRLLAGLPGPAPALLRAQSRRCPAAARRSAASSEVCKDGRVDAGFGGAVRHLSACPGGRGGVCKDGRVDGGNHLTFKAIRTGGGGLQREDVIGAADWRC